MWNLKEKKKTENHSKILYSAQYKMKRQGPFLNYEEFTLIAEQWTIGEPSLSVGSLGMWGPVHLHSSHTLEARPEPHITQSAFWEIWQLCGPLEPQADWKQLFPLHNNTEP